MDSTLPVEVFNLAQKLSITSSAVSDFSITDDQSKPQGFVVENIPLSKHPVILLSGGMKYGKSLSGVMEDGKSTTVPPIPPVLPNSDSTPRNSSNHEKWTGFGKFEDRLKLLHPDTTERFTEYIKKAPECTVDLIEAANDLGVPLNHIRIVRRLLQARCDIVGVELNKVRWVHDTPAEKELQRWRKYAKKMRFENLVKSMSNEKNANKYKWRWLFLTEGDMNNFVGFQNDVIMIVHCPPDINFEIPCPAQDGVVEQQRRYGIVRIAIDGEGNNLYIVSKVVSHDVVNLDETSFAAAGNGSSESEQGGLFPAERAWECIKIRF